MLNIRGKVEELINTYETNCPFKIAKCLGVKIEYINLGKKILGFYTLNNRIPLITINENTNIKQQIFICGHELGHHIYHSDVNTPFLNKHTFYSTNKIEIEAHTFAIELIFANKEIVTFEDIEKYGIPKQLAFLKSSTDKNF